MVAPARLLYVLPPFVDSFHCTVGAGLPDAAAVNVAVWPAVTVSDLGWLVIAGFVVSAGGGLVTVRVAALVVVESPTLVKTASYSLPLSATVVAVTVKVSDVAPAIGLNVVPAVGRHRPLTVGVGVPSPSR